MVQELVGMVPNKIHVLMQEFCICLGFSGYGAANKECQWEASLLEHTLRPVESSRHVKADEKLEIRLQLLCNCIAISYTCLLPILAPNVEREGIAVDIGCPVCCDTSPEFHGDLQTMRLCQSYVRNPVTRAVGLHRRLVNEPEMFRRGSRSKHISVSDHKAHVGISQKGYQVSLRNVITGRRQFFSGL